MKILYRRGDLLNTDCRIIAHGCNAQGVMGAGVAKVIRERWPSVYESYKLHLARYCCNKEQALGTVNFTLSTEGDYGSRKFIANIITQLYYGRKVNVQYVSYSAIQKAFECLNESMFNFMEADGSMVKVAMPKIGAGLAGGDWDIISKIIEEESTNFQPIVYEL